MNDWRLTPAARADLDDIWDYTVKTWGADQAEAYVRALIAACAGIATGATPTQDVAHVRPGYRKALSGRHVLYLRQSETGVEVVRILHQRMDVDRQSL
ncbi:type II toxin-antitoxin system RelE/ParE family toxin [uncultured Tateyamaria sp.]|uniref:type II toxin-antitoxin system RelE/ParE family toxin n=1 Tax=uncultured Tateyamaria sp. TaxID=455651 RepID=UPI002620F61E|nr:type II toxin-antitoxin system RelE/ParE family toxin [uncultured Tateyamaria sp.]